MTSVWNTITAALFPHVSFSVVTAHTILSFIFKKNKTKNSWYSSYVHMVGGIYFQKDWPPPVMSELDYYVQILIRCSFILKCVSIYKTSFKNKNISTEWPRYCIVVTTVTGKSSEMDAMAYFHSSASVGVKSHVECTTGVWNSRHASSRTPFRDFRVQTQILFVGVYVCVWGVTGINRVCLGVTGTIGAHNASLCVNMVAQWCHGWQNHGSRHL